MFAIADMFPQDRPRKIFSASRRIDMVVTDPLGLAEQLRAKADPEKTHTVVLWTKNPANILDFPPLTSQLKKYDQLYLNLSITGLGGSFLEPFVPPPEFVIRQLPALVDFFGSPSRLYIRFDPIVHLRLPDGAFVNNLDFFSKLAPVLQQKGIRNVTTSWVSIYPKVAKRLAAWGISAVTISAAEQEIEAAFLRRIAAEYNLQLYGCCVPGWPVSRCIDAELLNTLHPKGYRASTRRAKGQRGQCGCSASLDIGWYYPCAHGCLYCYANPRQEEKITN